MTFEMYYKPKGRRLSIWKCKCGELRCNLATHVHGQCLPPAFEKAHDLEIEKRLRMIEGVIK